MTKEEIIRGYEEIVESLEKLLDHENEAVVREARIQIDRCKRSIRELKSELSVI